MAERVWTKEQARAIHARGGTLLVSAAAGSGKTAVLVERVTQYITGDDPCDADRLLVVTFTNAAAAEMKERIARRIADLLVHDPLNRNLQRQQMLLQNAQISTIHSFCLNLIREHFEMLNIPPDFRIADENEVNLLRSDILAELLEERYTSELKTGSGPFLTLADMLGAGRDDAMLEDTILRLHDFVSSLPDPEGWMDDKLRLYDPRQRVADTIWGKAAFDHLAMVLREGIATLRDALTTSDSYELLEKCYSPALRGYLGQVTKALESVEALDWDGAYEAISRFHFDPLGAPRKFEYPEVRDEVKAKRDEVKKLIEKLRAEIVASDEAGFKEDMAAVYPLAVGLFEAVIELENRFYKAKLERSLLDFGDLEHLALRLLMGGEEGVFSQTAIARAISDRFVEVLVDEYQDTNPTQDAIFQAVSDNGNRLFMVGDVKQSIYRFRKATPELFIEKLGRFDPCDDVTYPAKIILGRNFRSRRGITDSVNFIFSQLMSRDFGEIDYGSEEALIPAAEYADQSGPEFTLHIVDTSDYDDNDGKDVLEARHIAREIKNMMEQGFTVKGENGQRPVRWRDFLILLRSGSARAEKYKRELTLAGVPVYADVAGGYLGSYEVEVMLALLRILDNPLQDVPLLSVLLSPIFGFTPDDLARIRIENRKGSLYLALVSYAKGVGGRFAEFLVMLDNLRRLAAVLPADLLILRIFEETGFLHICEAMSMGEARRANLRLLLEYARGYEAAGYKGLAGFLRFIDRVSDQDGDLSPASALSESADVVRIMSIHKSKGLEYPVVILAGLSNQFNREDMRRPALFHPVYGFGSIVRDERLSRYTTLPREIIKIETERSSLAEEMRVNYVALTRAKEKLICVATLPNPETTLKKAVGFLSSGELKLDPLRSARALSPGEWLIACALRHPDGGGLRKMCGMDDSQVLPCESRWEIDVVPAVAGQPQAVLEDQPEEVELDPELLREIEARAAFVYPYEAYSRIQSKVAVSEMAERETATDFAVTVERPSFMRDRALTSAQKGTAMHVFLQYADLLSIHDGGDIEREIKRLVSENYILPEEGEAVDAKKILGYVRSEIFAHVKSASKVYKEFRFNIEMDAAKLDGGSQKSGESVVVQGMADLIFEDDSGLYVLDFKTDKASEAELKHRYSEQLGIYAGAVEQIMKREVTAKYIYALSEEKLIKL